MLFNSFVFIVFACVFFALWPFLCKKNYSRWVYIIIASFFFYGWWDWRFLFLLAGTGSIDYIAGIAMVKWPSRKKLFLLASLTGNIGSLSVFKYLDFSIANINWLLQCIGVHTSIPLVHLILPVGISFYTFQSMSYSIDVYKGTLNPTKNILHFFAYISLFPQLVAGPIVRASHLLPQLTHYHKITEQERWEGTKLIVYGFFKKVVVADSFAPLINAAFQSEIPVHSCCYWWVVMVMFAFQIYCDFSGYSDIARGLAKWMGYDFPLNFNHPYLSTSFRDFWSRWHISLSTWFRNYVYIPLGGSRVGVMRSHLNTWIAMLTSGLWHGASWTFIIWGGLHAFFISLERITEWPRQLGKLFAGKLLSIFIMFFLIVISWVFFRSQTLGQAGFVLSQLFDIINLNVTPAKALIAGKVLLLLIFMLGRQAYVYFNFSVVNSKYLNWVKVFRPAFAAILICACIFMRGPGSAFIYFQF